MGKEQKEKGSPVYISILLQPPPSLPFILRNPTNRRLRVCGSAASPRLCSRSHNSFDRRTERFRFVENGNTNVSKLTCAPFHRFAVIIRGDLLFVVFELRRCTCLQEFARHLISSVHGGRCSPAETRTMRFSWMFVATVLLVLVTEARCKRKFDGDFEFAEEDDTRIMKVGDKKKWIHDPNSELCRPLNCKKKDLCLLKDTFTAVCVSKKELEKSGDIVIPKSRAVQQNRRMRTETSVDTEDDDAFFDSEDDDEDQDESKCQECPVVKPTFLCGSDNRTYSSPCRLEYHNCIHHTSVRIACKGFCPCKASDLRAHNKKMQLQRQKALSGKMRNRDITLTPHVFNYDNHHYQYLKYSKRAKALAGSKYDDKHLMSNEVMEKTPSPLKSTYNSQSSRNSDCPPSSKPAMANRLLDWFSVVMADSKHRRPHPKPKGHFPIGCQSEVRWMFGHLDSDNDGRLSLSELYGLEHDQNEPCLKPFLDGCDTDRDIFVSGPEWCGCFSKAERPCAAVRKRSSPDVAPACDSRGYYRSTQCHRGLGLCWCVDPHGVEFAGTRTRGSKPDCDTIVNKISNGGLKTNSVDLDDDEDGGTDSAQDLEGSADQPLDF